MALSNIQSRLLSALVILGTLMPLLWYLPQSFYALVIACAGVMLWEWGRMAQHQLYWLAGLLVGLASLSACFLWWLLTSILSPPAPQAFFAIIALITMTDVGAYITGKTIGRHTLAPRISPSKTVEGAIGGVVFSIAAIFILHYYTDWVALYADMVNSADNIVHGWPAVAWLALLAVIVSLCAEAGDLLESSLKRRFGVKDSSRLIPGHGGVWDRLDGYLLTLPVFTLLIMGSVWLTRL